MAVRSSMAALIARVRILINDTSGSPQFPDQTIQDVMDESRNDIINMPLKPTVTYTTTATQWLNYFSEVGGWEDDLVIKQYLTTVVTPATSEPIAGKFSFAATTFPPLYINGKQHDVYCAAADLLERLAALQVLNYDFTSDGQSFRRSQATSGLLNLACSYRKKQRPKMIRITRSDITGAGNSLSLKATSIDYIAPG